jgi:hypothetical protein
MGKDLRGSWKPQRSYIPSDIAKKKPPIAQGLFYSQLIPCAFVALISSRKRILTLLYHIICYLPSQGLGIYEVHLGEALQAHQHDFLLISFGE